MISFCVELAVATLLGLEGTRASAGAAAVTTTPDARVAAKPGATRRRTKESWTELRPVPRPFLTPKDRLTARTVLTASHTHSLDSPGVETTSVEPRDVGGADPGVPRDVGGADPGVRSKWQGPTSQCERHSGTSRVMSDRKCVDEDVAFVVAGAVVEDAAAAE